MNNISKFRIDRNLDPVQQNKILVNFIEEFSNNESLNFLINNLGSLYSVPNKVFEQDIQNMIFLDYRNSLGKFLPKYGIGKAIIGFFKYALFFLWILIFRNKKEKKIEKLDIIIDEIDHEAILWRFKPFAEKFKNYKYITSYVSKEKNTYFWNNYKNLNIRFNIKDAYKFVLLILLSLKKSLKDRINYVDIIFLLHRRIIKYKDIFSKIQSDYLLQDRHFTTSSLKSFIFKKYNGKKTILYQRNIAQINGPGMYTFADYFFSLGNLTHLQYLKCESKFEKVFPVGSFFMNSVKFNKKEEASGVPSYDLLHIASNMNHFQNTHNCFLDDWYEQFNWLVRFNKKYPQYKVGIKGRIGDGLKENKKFMKIITSSKIEFIDSFIENKSEEFSHNSLHSYDFAFKAKVNCTWQSTLGFELIGHGKPCMFLDPGGRNIAHLPNDDYHSALKVKDYDSFEAEFFKILKNESKYSNLKSDDYCLNSKSTHTKMYEILNNKSYGN